MTDQNKPTAARLAWPSGHKNTSAASSVNVGQALRQQAEARLLKKSPLSPEDIQVMSAETTRQMLFELRVHQIELEMQNEELRESQLALDIARTRYFDLYDLAPVGYCTIDENGLIKQANLTAARLLGVNRNVLVKQPLSRFIHKEDEDLLYLHRKIILKSGAPHSCELRIIKFDGTQVWVHLSCTVAEDVEGAHEVRAVMTDVTERKDADDALRESGFRYRNLINSIDEGFCVIELIYDEKGKPFDYRFLEVNPSFEKHSGLHQPVGKLISELTPQLEPHWFSTYGEVASMGKPARFIVEIKGFNYRWLDVHAFRLGGPESRKIAVLFDDITSRKDAEQKLKDAKIAADKANLAKSDFLSSMSHELRTPLNAILGFAQLLESGTPPPSLVQKQNLDHILQAGWYLLALINEILDLSVVESGKLSLSMEAVSLSEVLRECEAMILPQAQTRGIVVTYPHFDTARFVHADRIRVKQVLINLLSNAIKYNKAGGAVVVSCTETTPRRIHIRVEDTGDGLTPDQLAQLFQPFNRLGKETGPEEGTGIGLVVSKRIVELMQGAIGVESMVGKGSVFWIELNLTPELLTVLTPPPAETRPLPELAQGLVDTRLCSLLYIEDNPANLTLIEDIIARRTDIRLLSANNGERGIALARALLPDVILMDVALPDISGIDALKTLATDPVTAHIPVVALSANALPRDIENGLDAGFFRYLTKPIKLKELMDALDMALKFAHAETTPAAAKKKI